MSFIHSGVIKRCFKRSEKSHPKHLTSVHPKHSSILVCIISLSSNMSTEVPKDLPEMEYRFVGRSGLQISAISLGGWLTCKFFLPSLVRSTVLTPPDGGHVGDENTFACLKAAFDAGINFFDAAEGYAGGESERVMGRAIKHFGWNRNDIVVSTKVRPVSPCTRSSTTDSAVDLLGRAQLQPSIPTQQDQQSRPLAQASDRRHRCSPRSLAAVVR